MSGLLLFVVAAKHVEVHMSTVKVGRCRRSLLGTEQKLDNTLLERRSGNQQP